MSIKKTKTVKKSVLL